MGIFNVVIAGCFVKESITLVRETALAFFFGALLAPEVAISQIHPLLATPKLRNRKFIYHSFRLKLKSHFVDLVFGN